jgi:hypothetical protein
MSKFNLNLYEAPEELRLEFKINEFIDSVFGADVTAVVRNDFFLLTKPKEAKTAFRGVDRLGMFICREHEYYVLHDPILSRRGLAVGCKLKEECREVTDKNYDKKTLSYQKFLINFEMAWLESYMRHLKNSLIERISEGSPIIQKEVVRQSWADLVERMESLRQVINQEGQQIEYFVIPSLVEEICSLLAKLAGGRALLSGQAVEMLWIFNIINRIYIASGDAL